MKIKLRCGRAGHHFAQLPGDVLTIPSPTCSKEDAERMLAAGQAELADDADKPTFDPRFVPVVEDRPRTVKK